MILQVNNIAFNYTNQTYFKGIRNVSLQLGSGEVLGMVGKSGSGKTTILKCIYGLEDLQSGEIFLEHEKVLGPAFNLIPGHEDMKLVSQDFYVLENHTVEENIFDKLIGYTNEDKQKRAAKLLKLLELDFLKHTRAKHLSSGQKQRVAIARALAIIPKVLLLDEPFSNLDKLLSEKVFAFIIAEVKKNNTSVILVSHAAEEVLKYADTIAIVDKGQISQTGKKWDVYYKPKNSRLAGLLGDFNILHPQDFEKKFKAKTKLFLRPDKLKLGSSKNQADIMLHVLNCTYNGKCFEILGETKNGNSVIGYVNKALQAGKEFGFSAEV
ncbi:MAG: ABC transporter ATP-binding protein [Bacteroidetes bacterium]|nr:ABC transporter ATP-binding protein [Bacteroidota bacterium]